MSEELAGVDLSKRVGELYDIEPLKTFWLHDDLDRCLTFAKKYKLIIDFSKKKHLVECPSRGIGCYVEGGNLCNAILKLAIELKKEWL